MSHSPLHCCLIYLACLLTAIGVIAAMEVDHSILTRSAYHQGQLDCERAYGYAVPGWELPPAR